MEDGIRWRMEQDRGWNKNGGQDQDGDWNMVEDGPRWRMEEDE